MENVGLGREIIVSTPIFVGWDLYILNTRPARYRNLARGRGRSSRVELELYEVGVIAPSWLKKATSAGDYSVVNTRAIHLITETRTRALASMLYAMRFPDALAASLVRGKKMRAPLPPSPPRPRRQSRA